MILRDIMSKCMIVLLFFFLVSINIIITENAQAQTTSDYPNDSTSKSIASSENNELKIIGIDSTSFPKIKVSLFIDKVCAIAGNLKKENFKVREDNKEVAIDNFYFTGNASGQMLDLAVVFDDTGSMGEEISAMKSKVKGLTDTLKASGIDDNYALVSFKDSVSVKTNWTDNPEVFMKKVNSLQEKGGDDEPEVSLEAIEAVLSMGFRPDAQKVILVITDAHAHYKDDGSKVSSEYTKEEIEKDLKGSGAIFIPISPTFDKSSSYVDIREISNDIQSMWIDIDSAEFSTILEQIQGILTGTYGVEYTSPDQTPSEKRTVLISVAAPGCLEGSASSSYLTPGSAPIASNAPPVLNDLTSDKAGTQEVSTVITWTADAADPDDDQILYRFFLNDEPKTDWITGNSWTWTPDQVGSYLVQVQVRDRKHAGPNESDDFRISDVFEIKRPNALPAIDGLTSDKKSPQYTGTSVAWTADAIDPDGDQILYRFILNDIPKTKWQTDNTWIWGVTGPFPVDQDKEWNRVEVQVRDGKHAGPDEFDDQEFANFKLTGDDVGHSVQETTDGGYIIGGESAFPAGSNWLIKTDSKGNRLWDRTYGEIWGNNDESVEQTAEGGYIFTGGKPGWLLKTDDKGNLLWKKRYSDSSGSSVQGTTDGGYIVTGSKDFTTGYYDVWLLKTDADGSTLWEKTFNFPRYLETIYSSDGKSVQQTSDGGYIIECNIFINDGQRTIYPYKTWLIKTDAYGNKLWDKTFEKQDIDANHESVSDLMTRDGGYIIITDYTKSSGAGLLDVWLIKTDADGNKLWDRTFGGSSNDYGNSVHQTSDDGYIIVGKTQSFGAGNGDVWLIKTDAYGNELWDKIFGGSSEDGGSSVQQTSDGGYIITGYTKSSGAGLSDVWLIKTDADGNKLWDRTFGG
jgi:hypothetical protein